MHNITPKEAIANLNHIYGMVAPDIQRSIDVAIKALENQTTEGDLISREALKEQINTMDFDFGDYYDNTETIIKLVCDVIDNAQAVEYTFEEAFQKTVCEQRLYCPQRPQGKWYDFIPNCLKARHGEYVLYKVDFLLDNLAREVSIMESARRMKGGAE